MLNVGVDAQQRAREALKRVDNAITKDLEVQEEIQKKARDFHNTLYESFEFIGQEGLLLEEIHLAVQRLDAGQYQVENRNHKAFLMLLDPELAYDSKPMPASQNQSSESTPRWSVELAARLFVVFAGDDLGLLRYYTIFADGTWRRTVFALGSGGVQQQSALVPQSSPDVLLLEAIDLLGYVCTLHPTWVNLASVAETLTVEQVRNRMVVKAHPTGLGAPR